MRRFDRLDETDELLIELIAWVVYKIGTGFLSEQRLLRGPWQTFERDVARLLLANAFDDVRLVGGSGDRGADVLGVKNRQLWVFQCKHTTSGPPPRQAVGEVVEAARYYKADRLVVATSRPPGDAFMQEKLRYERTGLTIAVMDPRRLLEFMRNSPEFPVARKTLRDYQDDAAKQLREALLDTGRAQIVLATGVGKTVVMADVVADLLRDGLVEEDRVLVLAHTRELVDQLERSFWYQLPKWVPTHRMAGGETPSYWDGLTFGTVQAAKSRITSLPRGFVKLKSRKAKLRDHPSFAGAIVTLKHGPLSRSPRATFGSGIPSPAGNDPLLGGDAAPENAHQSDRTVPRSVGLAPPT